MKTEKPVALINVISQLGAGRRARGGGWATRINYLKRFLETAGVEIAEIITIREPENVDEGQSVLRHPEAVLRVCDQIREAVDNCHNQGLLPVCIGGDHSIAIGSVSATAEHYKTIGLLWLDAHVDMNTPQTTPSGNIHGMALATLCGMGHPAFTTLGGSGPKIAPSQAVALGLRFADKAELTNFVDSNPRVLTMRDLDRTGVHKAMDGVLPALLSDTAGFHLSLDLDALDPSVAPGVNTPFPGGMSFREVRAVCDSVAATGQMLSMDLVEHNPETGHDDAMLPVMGELLASSLGVSSMPY